MTASWEILDAATTTRKNLLRAGYRPIPATGKKPTISGWQDILATEPIIDKWFHQYDGAFNTGILTRTTPAIDIDVYDPDVAEAIEALIWEMIGARGMVRFGQPPKRAVLFRAETPFKKIVTPLFTAPSGTENKVEVLADGQQVIVFGTHPDTGKAYSWHGGQPGDVARADLPELTEVMAREFIDKAVAILRAQAGWIERERKPNGGNGMFHDFITTGNNSTSGSANNEFDTIYGDRERKYALAALAGCAAELADMAPGGRNDKANALAFRLGTMSARGWISRDEVTDRLFEAAIACGLVADVGEAGARATIESGLSSGERTPHPDLTDETQQGDKAPAGDDILTYSDEVLAQAFIDKHLADLRYTALWGQWLTWDGRRWMPDDRLATFSLVRQFCYEQARQAGNKEAKGIASAGTVAAIERLAKADQRIAITVNEWDADPWLLNTPSGTVNLRTGEMYKANPGDKLTKITGVAPNSNCSIPVWTKFLVTVTGGDSDLTAFIQRMAGYSLTGSTREHALFFLYGTGANGKSTFLNAITACTGEYHRAAPIETFTASSTERHPTELAGLRGARLVTAVETEEGRRWDESKIKALTGGDTISARFMRQDFFEYVPQFKLIIAGNHKPGLRSVDEAIRRRFNLVPFTVTIPPEVRDPEFPEKLKAELPGILAWMISGCRAWLQQGLAPPQAVTEATAAYLTGEDAISAWIDECCRRDPNSFATLTHLFVSWNQWATKNGEYAGTTKKLASTLESKGFQPHRKMSARGLIGLRVLPEYEQA